MTKKHRALFLVPPEVQLLDMSGPAHIFYEAKEYGAPIESHFIGLTTNTVASSAGIQFSKLESFKNFQLTGNDWVFVPGLESHLFESENFILNNQPFYDWLNTQHKNGAKICSVYTGAYLLAQSGLLNGRQCTTHWKYLDQFRKEFPDAHLQSDRLFTIDENVYTSAGVSSGIDLSLFLIEQFFGTKLALDIAKETVIYFRRSASDPQLSVFLQYRNHIDQRIHNAQDYLTHHVSDAPTAEELANQVHMSKRNLTRLFKNTVGITIGKYLEKLRIEKAISLLSEGNKVDFVAKQVGLKSANQLRSILKKHQDILPTDISSLDK